MRRGGFWVGIVWFLRILTLIIPNLEERVPPILDAGDSEDLLGFDIDNIFEGRQSKNKKKKAQQFEQQIQQPQEEQEETKQDKYQEFEQLMQKLKLISQDSDIQQMMKDKEEDKEYHEVIESVAKARDSKKLAKKKKIKRDADIYKELTEVDELLSKEDTDSEIFLSAKEIPLLKPADLETSPFADAPSSSLPPANQIPPPPPNLPNLRPPIPPSTTLLPPKKPQPPGALPPQLLKPSSNLKSFSKNTQSPMRKLNDLFPPSSMKNISYTAASSALEVPPSVSKQLSTAKESTNKMQKISKNRSKYEYKAKKIGSTEERKGIKSAKRATTAVSVKERQSKKTKSRFAPKDITQEQSSDLEDQQESPDTLVTSLEELVQYFGCVIDSVQDSQILVRNESNGARILIPIDVFLKDIDSITGNLKDMSSVAIQAVLEHIHLNNPEDSQIDNTKGEHVKDNLSRDLVSLVVAENDMPSQGEDAHKNSVQPTDQVDPIEIKEDNIALPESTPDKKFNFDHLEVMSGIMDSDLTDEHGTEGEGDVQVQINETGPLEALGVRPPNSCSSTMPKYETQRLEMFIEEGEVNLKQEEIVNLELSMKKTKSNVICKNSMPIESNSSFENLSREESNRMLLQLIKEREIYKQKLRLAKQAIQSHKEHYEKSLSLGQMLDPVNRARIHLAFMFSSPLIRRFNNKVENIMQLDYLTEINDVVKVCNKIKYEMKFKTAVATVSNLRSVITDGPIALHFSGHGLQNTPENLGSDYALSKGKGNILLLEDEHGMSDYFFEEDLKYMIEMSQTEFEVVFVSSCHSQFAGQVFLNAGSKHVICIRGGEKISDRASLRFSKVFYETLFVKNYNVCTSFHIAKEEINKVINPAEASKFMLLIQEDDGCSIDPYGRSKSAKNKHRCYPLANFKEGELSDMNDKPMFDSNPSNVEGFIGRQQEMYDIIHLLDQHRLVSILGPPGIGKTSLARNLANYLKDRRKFSDGIIYVALRGCETAQMFLTRLSLVIRAAWSYDECRKYGLDKIEKGSKGGKNKAKDKTEEDADNESKYRSFILNVLRDKEVLLIMDNAEDPLEDDNAKFVSELESIIDHCIKIKFLVTTRKTINKLAYNHEKPYTLCPLTKEASLKLLISKAPREIKNKEIHELLNWKIPEESKIGQSLNISSITKPQSPKNLLNHPFTMLLGGHPQAISLAAPLLEYKSLKELFLDFCNSNLMDALDISPVQTSNTSLRVSLELSITHMKNTVPEALTLFAFIGLLPGGVTEAELTQMWGSTSWLKLKDALVRASLLVYKIDDAGGFVYSMLPFMTVRAYELLEENEDKRLYHMKVWRLYKDYWYEFYLSDKTMEKVEILVGMETNIWACIYRSCNRKRDIQFKAEPLTQEMSEGGNTLQKFDTHILNDVEGDQWDIKNDAEEVGAHQSQENSAVDRGLRPITPVTKNGEDDQIDSEKNGTRTTNTPQRLIQKNFEENKFFDEEMLVIYYITDLLMLNKNSDALKALTEYLKKPEISPLCLANLYKAHAVLCLISKDTKDPEGAIEWLKKSSKCYSELGLKKGVAMCKFGLAKVYSDCWSELIQIFDKTEQAILESSLHFCQSALKLFKQVN